MKKGLLAFVSVLMLAMIVACGAPDPESVELDQTEVEVVVGETVTVEATVEPEDAEQEITWSSADTDIATVDDGVITGVEIGTTTITATATGTDVSADVTVEVVSPYMSVEDVYALEDGEAVDVVGVVTKVTNHRTFYIGDDTGGIAVYDGDDAFIYDEGEEEDDLGVQRLFIGDYVRIQGERDEFNGLEQIGSLTDVEIMESGYPLPASSDIEVSDDDEDMRPYMGRRVNIEGLVVDDVSEDNFGNITVDFFSVETGNEISMRYDSRLENFVDDAPGYAAHLLSFEEGNVVDIDSAILGWYNGPQLLYTYSGEVTESAVPYADYIALDDPDQSEISLAYGSTETINATVYPTGAPQNITWTSSDEDVVTVEDGVLTPVDTGSATITVRATGTDQLVFVAVTVYMPSIADVHAAEDGEDVVTEGVITNITDSRTFFIQDASGAIAVYDGGDEYLEDMGLAVGDLVRVFGERDAWSGLEQISGLTAVEVLETDQDLPDPADIDGIDLEDNEAMLPYQGMRVSFTEMIVSGPNSGEADESFNIELTDPYNGSTIDVRYESYHDDADLAAYLSGLEEGDVVDVVNMTLGWFDPTWMDGGAQLLITAEDQLVAGTLSADAVEAYLTANITLPEETTQDLTLPIEYTLGAWNLDIAWASDNEDVIATDGTVTRPEEGDAEVELTATITDDNDFELILTFMVLVPEAPDEPETYTEHWSTFEGSGTSYVTETFIGDSGFEWTVTESRKDLGGYEIDGGGIMFRGGGTFTATIDGGIDSLSLDILMGFTGGAPEDRTVEIYIDDVLVGSHTLSSTDVETLVIEDIDVEGEFELKIENAGDDRQIVLNNLEWTEYWGEE